MNTPPSQRTGSDGLPRITATAAWRQAEEGLGGLPNHILLPAAVLGPLFFGMAILAALRAGLIGPTAATVWTVVGITCLITGLLLWTSARLRQADSARREAVEALRIRDRALRDRQAEREELLEQALADREAATRAARARDVLLATVSHELRSPLNALELWTALLEARRDAQTVEDACRHIRQSVGDLSRQIGDLLDVSRIATGKLDLELQPIDLGALAFGLVEQLSPGCGKQGVELTLTRPEGALSIEGDGQRLTQVLRNLIENALKFTSGGGRIAVELSADAEMIGLAVVDTGRGIREDELGTLFEPFTQAHAGDNQSLGGLGLGLYIVRQIVERHGGTIAVESAGEGRGATFRVRLPRLEAT